MRGLAIFVAGSAIVSGAVLGIACAPCMLSANIVDVAGAGLGCVAGAVLLGSGLQAFAGLVPPSGVTR
jgi:hypothetical protein